jgi:hypothetical protein
MELNLGLQLPIMLLMHIPLKTMDAKMKSEIHYVSGIWMLIR